MLESKGLILCVDANDILSERRDFIKDFFFHSVNTLLTNGFQSILPFKRVCVALTKADLWAQNSGMTTTHRHLSKPLIRWLRQLKLWVSELLNHESLYG